MNKDSWYKAVKRRVTWPLAKTGATAKGGGSGSLATQAKTTKEYFLSGVGLQSRLCQFPCRDVIRWLRSYFSVMKICMSLICHSLDSPQG
jgi:hypothetical protein